MNPICLVSHTSDAADFSVGPRVGGIPAQADEEGRSARCADGRSGQRGNVVIP